MPSDFKAKVKRAYPLKDRRVLVLAPDVHGDVEAGAFVDVGLPSGEVRRARVESVAWGSAFHAEDSALTLVVEGLRDGDEPAAGAEVRGV